MRSRGRAGAVPSPLPALTLPCPLRSLPSPPALLLTGSAHGHRRGRGGGVRPAAAAAPRDGAQARRPRHAAGPAGQVPAAAAGQGGARGSGDAGQRGFEAVGPLAPRARGRGLPRGSDAQSRVQSPAGLAVSPALLPA